MWAAVEFTHHRGVKLKNGQVHPRGVLRGEITSYAIGSKNTHAVGIRPGHVGADLANLYCIRLVAIGKDAFRLAGLERCGDPPAWVHQEWICRLEPRPPDLPEPGRPGRNIGNAPKV
jgi:hypothetical protein